MKKSLKIFFPIFLFLLCVQAVDAQTYQLSPGNTVTIKQTVSYFSGGKIHQKNLTPNPITLKYVKVSNDWTGNYMGELCDNGLCYPYLPESGTYQPIGPLGSWNQWANMYVKAGFTTTPGTYKIQYAIWDVANPSHKDTLTFIFEVSADPIQTFSVDEVAESSFVVSPNPVKDILTITMDQATAGYEVEIMDMKGAKLNSFVSPGQVNVSGLPSGVYYIKATTESTVYTQKFVKE